MIDVKSEMRYILVSRLLKQTAEETRQTTKKANVSLCKAPVPKARSQLPERD